MTRINKETKKYDNGMIAKRIAIGEHEWTLWVKEGYSFACLDRAYNYNVIYEKWFHKGSMFAEWF